MENISITTKIKILLEGELIHMPKNLANEWFDESFKWIEKNERYKLGVKLMDAKERWEKQKNIKNNSEIQRIQ